MKTASTFGQLLREARERAGLSQEAVADKLAEKTQQDISRVSIAHWETNKHRPARDRCVALSSVLYDMGGLSSIEAVNRLLLEADQGALRPDEIARWFPGSQSSESDPELTPSAPPEQREAAAPMEGNPSLGRAESIAQGSLLYNVPPPSPSAEKRGSHTAHQKGGKHNLVIQSGDHSTIQVDHSSSEFPKWLRKYLWLLTALLAALSIGSVAIAVDTFRPQKPGPMAGDFRVAVAGLAIQGEGIDQATADGWAQNIADQLEEQTALQTASLDPPLSVTVWGPAQQVGRVTGNTPKARDREAAAIAERLDATLVVYGVVETDAQSWHITPEFYIAETPFQEAEELTGPHGLGESFAIRNEDDTSTRQVVSNRLLPRTELLTQIVMGLTYYINRDFEMALTTFEEAEHVTDWEALGGGQTLSLLLGNTSGKLAKLDAAEQHFQQALTVDPEYARAYIGLGSVHYMRALASAADAAEQARCPKADLALLTEAIALYQQAGEAHNQPEAADIPVKVSFGLGQSYLLLSCNSPEHPVAPALREFQTVITAYDMGNKRVRELAGEAHARLGLIYDMTGYLEQAAGEYEAAAMLLSDAPDRADLYKQHADGLRRELAGQREE